MLKIGHLAAVLCVSKPEAEPRTLPALDVINQRAVRPSWPST